MANFYNATDLIPTGESAGTTVSAGPYGLGLKGDFIGFTFNGEHSSDMGITRVSNGNRFNDTLLPNFSDKTGSVTGMDGMYYFGSQYGQKPIQIQIAFDYLTERGLRHLKQVFGDKKPHWIIFDEAPYKKYLVKLAQPIQLTYICFMEDNQRIYKGEGSIGFVAYKPFAYSVAKDLNSFDSSNIDEWAPTSGMLNSLTGSYDTYGTVAKGFKIYNPGDFETDFKLYIPFNNNTVTGGNLFIAATQNLTDDYEKQVYFNDIVKQTNDSQATHLCFNSSLKLIEGAYKNTTTGLWYSTGVVYNKFITAGQLFKLPIVNSSEEEVGLYLITDQTYSSSDVPILVYDYLYY